MGKKIYIVTLGAQYMFSNVGTFLQHWALRRVLTRMGYVPVRVALPTDYTHPVLNNYSWIKSIIKSVVRVILHYVDIPKYAKVETRSIKTFRDYLQLKKFRREFVSNIGSCIEDTSLPGDVLILGGDQVLTNVYKWLSETKALKYISFAASADWRKKAELEEWRDDVKRKLYSFSKIGIREHMGVMLMKEMNIESTKVADPVMLMKPEDLNSFAGSKLLFKNSTLFVYLLNVSSKEDLHIGDLSFVSDNFNCDLRMYGIQGAQYHIPQKYYLNLGPTEFVRAIKDAKYIITNSYHGTVVALLFHKPFISVIQERSDIIKQNIRQQELLDWVGLSSHRISMADLKLKSKDLLEDQIDWDSIDKKIEEFRSFSIEWLIEAIES